MSPNLSKKRSRSNSRSRRSKKKESNDGLDLGDLDLGYESETQFTDEEEFETEWGISISWGDNTVTITNEKIKLGIDVLGVGLSVSNDNGGTVGIGFGIVGIEYNAEGGGKLDYFDGLYKIEVEKEGCTYIKKYYINNIYTHTEVQKIPGCKEEEGDDDGDNGKDVRGDENLPPGGDGGSLGSPMPLPDDAILAGYWWAKTVEKHLFEYVPEDEGGVKVTIDNGNGNIYSYHGRTEQKGVPPGNGYRKLAGYSGTIIVPYSSTWNYGYGRSITTQYMLLVKPSWDGTIQGAWRDLLAILGKWISSVSEAELVRMAHDERFDGCSWPSVCNPHLIIARSTDISLDLTPPAGSPALSRKGSVGMRAGLGCAVFTRSCLL
ncbi:MAG: hypothetical protein F6K40_24005 [Okeania sp. SIO3I5]|uniref:hypothetical protein n=1 Tax=Okeania sp. SIO3I5 TaxID=2607805 RepID=UPI0013BC4EA8|nr:hypothetical protein [Okeania sp. SIO3I5]NEQ39149.1 hypothetical protein [Okeania sp. SIO3I5]